MINKCACASNQLILLEIALSSLSLVKPPFSTLDFPLLGIIWLGKSIKWLDFYKREVGVKRKAEMLMQRLVGSELLVSTGPECHQHRFQPHHCHLLFQTSFFAFLDKLTFFLIITLQMSFFFNFIPCSMFYCISNTARPVCTLPAVFSSWPKGRFWTWPCFNVKVWLSVHLNSPVLLVPSSSRLKVCVSRNMS